MPPRQAGRPAGFILSALRLAAETLEVAAEVDAFLLPTASNLAPGLETTGDPSFQSPWSLIGWPSISLPSGISADGLPFAVQLVARSLDEVTLLRAAWKTSWDSAAAPWTQLSVWAVPQSLRIAAG